MIDVIVQGVLNNWGQILPNHPRPARLVPVLQSRNRVVVFLFAMDAREAVPLVVVKISRFPGDNERLERSTSRLQSVRTMLDPSLQAAVPRAVVLEQVNGLSATAETMLKGEPIAPRTLNSPRWRISARDCHAFVEWLLAFQHQTVAGHQRITETMLAEALVAPLSDCLGTAYRVQDRVWLERASEKLVGFKIPLGWRYGDAHPSNILVDGGAVSGVVDWEGAEPDQWPIMDWFHFALMYAIECCKKTHPSWGRNDLTSCALQLLICPPTHGIAHVLQNETRHFLSRYELDWDTLPALLMIFLLKLWWEGDKTSLINQALHHFQQPA